MSLADRSVFYPTNRSNVPSIVAAQRVHTPETRPANAAHAEIWSPSIVAARRTRVLPVPPGTDRTIGGCVGMYWLTRNPAVHNIVTGWKGAPKIANTDLVFFRTTPRALTEFPLERIVVDRMATSNVNGHEPTFGFGDDALGLVPWEVINTRSWGGDADRTSQACSELLVAGDVPLKAYFEVICYDREDELRAMFEVDGGHRPRVVRSPWDYIQPKS